MYFLIPETKGKSLERMDEVFGDIDSVASSGTSVNADNEKEVPVKTDEADPEAPVTA